MLGALMVGSSFTGGPLPPMPARKNAWGIYDVFTSRDGTQVFIGCTSDNHWQRFCERFGFIEWATDERLAGNAKRCEAREWMLPILKDRLSTLSIDEILQKCEAANVPYARVGRPDQLSDDQHLNAFGGLIRTAVSGMGGGPLVGIPALPVEFGDGRERPGLERQPPRIGEHSGEVLAEAGFGRDEIASLQASGVVRAT